VHRSDAFRLLLPMVALIPVHASAQALGPSRPGPVIEGFGPVFDVEAPTFPTPEEMTLRAVFEVSTSAESEDQVNRRIETVARFVGMRARAGVPADRVQAALVVHGSAGKDLLNDEGYRRRYGIANPDALLVKRLLEAGVQVVLCGQTQMSRGLKREELVRGVDVGLSAMTSLLVFQDRGYALIPT
jgi:intracellular sulfur oxidation DsrE/DsrF family protein